jgi:hypothetical protein
MMPAVMNKLYVDFYYYKNQTQFSLIRGDRNFSKGGGGKIFRKGGKTFRGGGGGGGAEPSPLAPLWLRHLCISLPFLSVIGYYFIIVRMRVTIRVTSSIRFQTVKEIHNRCRLYQLY